MQILKTLGHALCTWVTNLSLGRFLVLLLVLWAIFAVAVGCGLGVFNLYG